MNVPDDLIVIVRQWVSKAEEDLRLADLALSAREDVLCAGICFHAQQCIEKYIKGLLVFLSMNFPKVHELGELIGLLPPEIQPLISIVKQERFTAYASVCRYPGDWNPIDLEEASDAVFTARSVRDAVRSKLPQEALQ